MLMAAFVPSSDCKKWPKQTGLWRQPFGPPSFFVMTMMEGRGGMSLFK
jgi:hypothetical protein